MFSCVGITPKELDSKNKISGISDFFDTILNKFGWAFNLTYKSPFRTILSCCKSSLIKKCLKDSDYNE